MELVILLVLILGSIVFAACSVRSQMASENRRLARLERPNAVRPDWYVERKMQMFERDVTQDAGRWN